MKPKQSIQAYAIVDMSTGEPATLNYRVPVFWHLRLAKDEMIDMKLDFASFEVKRVSIQVVE